MSTIIGLVSTFRLPLQESGELDLETMKIQEKVQSIHDRTIKWTLKHPRAKWMSKKSARV